MSLFIHSFSFGKFDLNHSFVKIDTYFLNFTNAECFLFVSYWCVYVLFLKVQMCNYILYELRFQGYRFYRLIKKKKLHVDKRKLIYLFRWLQVIFITTLHRPRLIINFQYWWISCCKLIAQRMGSVLNFK